MNWEYFIYSFIAILSLATMTWIISVIKKDVSIVDSAWSLMFVAGAAVLLQFSEMSLRSEIIFILLVIWAGRLSAHITLRSWGEDEDHRYQAIRNKYQPYFAIKSFFIIFVFQAILASIVILPVGYALLGDARWNNLDYLALILVIIGIGYESIADYQLYRFKKDQKNKGKVLDTGLWKYSRHPNYFGEALIWWGFFLFAASQGNLIAIISPLLMTFLLLKFSGVGLMEVDISDRRPTYRQYIESTNAFFPGFKKSV